METVGREKEGRLLSRQELLNSARNSPFSVTRLLLTEGPQCLQLCSLLALSSRLLTRPLVRRRREREGNTHGELSCLGPVSVVARVESEGEGLKVPVVEQICRACRSTQGYRRLVGAS